MSMQQQLVTSLANEQGRISVDEEVGQPEVEVDISIREDSLRMFETESGDLLLRTPDMEAEVYLEVIPTHEGVTAGIAVEPESQLEELEPAEPLVEDVDVGNDSVDVVRYD